MYQIERSATATTVHVRCEIDYASKLEFEAVLARASSLGSPQLIVSLDECPYLDCAGVSALVKIRNKSRSPMSVILRESSHLWKLFSILGLKEVLNVTSNFRAVDVSRNATRAHSLIPSHTARTDNSVMCRTMPVAVKNVCSFNAFRKDDETRGLR